MIVQSHRARRVQDALAEAQVKAVEQVGLKRKSTSQASSAESLAVGLEAVRSFVLNGKRWTGRLKRNLFSLPFVGVAVLQR